MFLTGAAQRLGQSFITLTACIGLQAIGTCQEFGLAQQALN